MWVDSGWHCGSAGVCGDSGWVCGDNGGVCGDSVGCGGSRRAERVYDCSYTRSGNLKSQKKKHKNQLNTRTTMRTCVHWGRHG